MKLTWLSRSAQARFRWSCRLTRQACATHCTAHDHVRSSPETGPLRVFLVAGEPSGDGIGSCLMRAMQAEHCGRIEFSGVGGSAMEASGMRSLFPMADLSVMGFAEILPALPTLAFRLRQTLAAARATRPHLVVGIDSKGFCLRMLRALASDRKSCGRWHRPVLAQYVAPSAWAFVDAQARAGHLDGTVDELLLILPFEKALYGGAGVPCTFVGHPCTEVGPSGSAVGSAEAAARLRARCGISDVEPVITALPGSRCSEVRAVLPSMLEALRRVSGTTRDAPPYLVASCMKVPMQSQDDFLEADCNQPPGG